MNLSCVLTLDAPFTHIEPLLRTEMNRPQARSSISIDETQGTTITVSASDVSAFRAALNSITSILKVYETTNGTRKDA